MQMIRRSKLSSLQLYKVNKHQLMKVSRGSIPASKSIFKMAMLGYYGVGKSGILTRFSQKMFEEDYQMTLTPNHTTRLFHLQANISVKLQLIDTPGGGFVKQMVNNVIPECDAILLVYDITNEESFYRIGKWFTDMSIVIKKETLLVIVGTHLDQPYKRKITQEEVNKWKKINNVELFFQVSSKTNENITDMFQAIGRYLLMRQNNISESHKCNEDVNPEISTTTIEQDKETNNQISRITLLQKKLSFKEAECIRLWDQYEQALKRINELENNRSQRGQNSNIFGSFKQWSSDSQDLQLKIKMMEQNIRILEQFYTSKQIGLQESCCNKIKQSRIKMQQMQNQYQQLHELSKLQTDIISSLETFRDELLIKVNQLTFDYQQNQKEYNHFKIQIQKLIKSIEDKALFRQNSTQNNNNYQCQHYQTRRLYHLFIKLIKYLQQNQTKIFQTENLLKAEIKNNQVSRNNLQGIVSQLKNQKYNLEQNLRLQVIIRKGFQMQRERLDNLLIQTEINWNIKFEQFQQILQGKQKSIKLIIANSKLLQQNLLHQKQQYNKLYAEFQQKSKLLQKKQQLLGRVAEQKLNQINQLKGFIEKLGNNSKKMVQKYAKTLNHQLKNSPSQQFILLQQQKEKYIQFFTSFIYKIKQKSMNTLANLQQLHHSFQYIKEQLTLINKNYHTFQISQHLFYVNKIQLDIIHKKAKLDDFKKYINNQQLSNNSVIINFVDQFNQLINNFHDWELESIQNIKIESNKKGVYLNQGLCSLQNQFQQNNNIFIQNLTQINQYIEYIQEINEIGISQYIKQYFS